MRSLLAILTISCAWCAEPWSLGRLFTRPFIWGTPPSGVTWSKQGHALVFLWNAEGRRFLDLYSYNPDTQKLVRLTNLESAKDELNQSESDKDDRLKKYLLPAAGLSAFDLSRDGARVLFSHEGDLYIAKTDGSAPPFRLTRTKTPETFAQFSPDGAKIAFLRTGQLFVQDLANGQLWQVTDGETVSSYKWSPDGKRFVYATRAGQGRQLPLPNYSGRIVTTRSFNRALAGDEPVQSKSFTIAADGGKPLALDAGPWGAKVWGFGLPEWSPDSARLIQRVIHPDMKRAQILMLDAVTGKAKVVVEEHDPAWVNDTPVGWSRDSREVFYLSDRDGWSHLYKVAEEGKPVQLTHGQWEIHREVSLYPHDPQWIGDYLYYTSTEGAPSERHFYRVKADGSGKERLSAGEGVNVGIESEDGRHTAMLHGDLRHPLSLFVDGRRVTDSESAQFSSYPWPETHFVNFPSRIDRKNIAAKILLPPGYRLSDRKRKWPAVFFIHGSGYATSVLKQWGSYQELRYVFNCYLANKGYVVFDLDYRGSSGYGRDWRTGVYLDMGGPDLQDVLGEIDYARGLGNIDMTRIAIWGVSYGGFMTDMAMFRAPDAFAAGAAFSAVNDWENYNAFYTEQRLNRPQDNPEAYRRSSPIYFSSMLKHPLLIVHGMVDDNVMFQDAVQLSEKLIHEGKRFSQIYYPEESHGFVRDETLIDAFQRTAEFFDKELRAK